eukprot:gb/GEZN01015279.1/.p1 GENE.gb/GEZN01015279.1/~~gb/GEZN01015279.1/.p1  ORF type:complete len:281 (+),score=35.54 gb/GEZN01015279.1/:28-870(+)
MGGKDWMSIWLWEFISSAVVIIAVFPPGQWYFHGAAWSVVFVMGMLASAQRGPTASANPCWSFVMWLSGWLDFPLLILHWTAQVAGASFGFALCRFIGSDFFGLPALAGPTLRQPVVLMPLPSWSSSPLALLINPSMQWIMELSSWFKQPLFVAGLDEFLSCFVLNLSKLLICVQLPDVLFSKQQSRRRWWFCEVCMGCVVRFNLQFFPSSGPALDPAIATGYAFIDSGLPSLSTDWPHYFVYWFCACLGGAAALLVHLFVLKPFVLSLSGSQIKLGKVA